MNVRRSLVIVFGSVKFGLLLLILCRLATFMLGIDRVFILSCEYCEKNVRFNF